ncbi:MAG: flagellar basal body-associated FliL family protein [Mariprofundus sp.]|nr:flagellar basal body-associated FliL family protein [Mariprofundus sp.]
MADNEEGEDKGKSGGGGLLPIINLVLLVLVLAVGGFVAWKLISMEQPTEQSVAAVEQSDETTIPEADDETDAPPVFMDIDNITVNLADTDQSRFLRTKIKLEVRNEEAKIKVNENMIKINDLVITILSSKKFSEIRTPQGKYALKEDLVYRMNRAVGGKPIKNLYFTDFVSQ